MLGAGRTSVGGGRWRAELGRGDRASPALSLRACVSRSPGSRPHSCAEAAPVAPGGEDSASSEAQGHAWGRQRTVSSMHLSCRQQIPPRYQLPRGSEELRLLSPPGGTARGTFWHVAPLAAEPESTWVPEALGSSRPVNLQQRARSRSAPVSCTRATVHGP